jgi:5S rRNA maturation endonuclease (ribonuclease M5)
VSEPAFDRVWARIVDKVGMQPRSSSSVQAMARCPVHDDTQASLSITRATDRVLLKCHAGCDIDDILTALGLTRGDLFDEPKKATTAPQVVAEYNYVDEQGKVLFVVERRFPKSFRQKRKDESGKWIYKLGDIRRVLYRLPAVLNAVENGETVYVVEGEKDVHTLETLGVIATCNPMGAGKWRPEYTLQLKGAKVTVIADADEPGRRHATAVAHALREVRAEVTIVEPKEGKDVSDHISAGHSLGDLQPIRPELHLINGGGDVDAAAQDAGIQFINWAALFSKPKTKPDWLAQPLLARGRVTTVYSPGKSGKSLLAIEIAAGLATGMPLLAGDSQGRDALDVLYIDQEMTEEDWLDRLTDMGYGPNDVDQFEAHLHVAQLQGWEPMDTRQGGAQLAAVVEQVKAQVVVIDTQSKLVVGKENENDTHQAFYRNSVVPLKRAGLAVLVLDHTGKDVERGARGGSAKTDNVDLAWELLPRGKDLLALRCTHARFRDESLAEFITVRRQTAPLKHVIESTEERQDHLLDVCLKHIRRLAPGSMDSSNEVLQQLQEEGHGFRKQTFQEAYRLYQQENGWSY